MTDAQLGDPQVAAFAEYVAAFGRGYRHGTAEYEKRHAIFASRMSFIQAHNSQPQRRWTAGVNELTDRTDEELAQLRGWRRAGGNTHRESSAGAAGFLAGSATILGPLLDNVSWAHLSMAGDIPDQGGCGSCWAFATATMLRARYEAKNDGKDRTFSAQQLVDCTPNPHECGGQGGCSGSTVELAMAYVEDAGLMMDEDIPYSGVEGKCGYPTRGPALESSLLAHTQWTQTGGYDMFGLRHWYRLPENKAAPLMHAVAEGPVAISVSAGRWTDYAHGIFDGCPKDVVLDHAVVLFGYSQEGDTKYWLVRNSWGGQWGEKGYIRLLRRSSVAEEDAYCGTNHHPSVGTACKPYPETQPVCGTCGILFDSVAASF
eukprot:CAMPEP_0117487712 /NCGR_PEP_ID=MMETSP0784-20121206/16137_1 /TAXON_ID=39447 /ORGANISM="" /LENGTH=372 /DNA_ID=CAMNT_0005282369 /DNA_START=122 /DNA_END=1240 /DNA_ORIENTATION=-